jgi:hypothetical protein
LRRFSQIHFKARRAGIFVVWQYQRIKLRQERNLLFPDAGRCRSYGAWDFFGDVATEMSRLRRCRNVRWRLFELSERPQISLIFADEKIEKHAFICVIYG